MLVLVLQLLLLLGTDGAAAAVVAAAAAIAAVAGFASSFSPYCSLWAGMYRSGAAWIWLGKASMIEQEVSRTKMTFYYARIMHGP